MVTQQSTCAEAKVVVDALRHEISQLERKRRRFQLQAEQREADLRDEVARLLVENQKLAAAPGHHKPPPALGLERPLRLAEENLRLTDENRSLRAEREKLANELKRLAAQGSNKCMHEAGDHLALPAEFKLDAASQTEADDNKSADVSFQEASTQSEVSCCSVSTQCETDDEKDSPTDIGSQAKVVQASRGVTNNSTEPTRLENQHCHPDPVRKHESLSVNVVSRSELENLRLELAEWRQTCAKLAEDQKAIIELGSSKALHLASLPVGKPSSAQQAAAAAEAVSQSATPEAKTAHTLHPRRPTSPEDYQTEIRSCLLELALVRNDADAAPDARQQSASQPQKPQDERLSSASCLEDALHGTAAAQESSLQAQVQVDIKEQSVLQRLDQLADMHEHIPMSQRSSDMRPERPQPLHARQQGGLQPPEPKHKWEQDNTQPPKQLNLVQANAANILHERHEFKSRSPEPLGKTREHTSQPPEQPNQQQEGTLQPQEPVDGRQQGACTLQPPPNVKHSRSSPAPDQVEKGLESRSQIIPPLNVRRTDFSQTQDPSEERSGIIFELKKIEGKESQTPEALDATPVSQPPEQLEGASQPPQLQDMVGKPGQLPEQLDATEDSPLELGDAGLERTVQPPEQIVVRRDGKSQQAEQPNAQDEACLGSPEPADARQTCHLQPREQLGAQEEAVSTLPQAPETSEGAASLPSAHLETTAAVNLQPEYPLKVETESAVQALEETPEQNTSRAQELPHEKHGGPLQHQEQPDDRQEGQSQQQEPLGEQTDESMQPLDLVEEKLASDKSVSSSIGASTEEEGRESTQGLEAMRPTPLDMDASPLASCCKAGSRPQEIPGKNSCEIVLDGLHSSPPTRRSGVIVHQPVTPETPNALLAMKRVESDGSDSSLQVSPVTTLQLTKQSSADVVAAMADPAKAPEGKLAEDVPREFEVAALKAGAALESDMNSLDQAVKMSEMSIKGDTDSETEEKQEGNEQHHVKHDSPRSSCDFSGGIGWLDEVWPGQETECVKQVLFLHPDSTPTRINRHLTILELPEENNVDDPSNPRGQLHSVGQWHDAHEADEDGVTHSSIQNDCIGDKNSCSDDKATQQSMLGHNSRGGNEQDEAEKADLTCQQDVNAGNGNAAENVFCDGPSVEACAFSENNSSHATLVLPLRRRGSHGGEEDQTEDEGASESCRSSEVSSYCPTGPGNHEFRRAKTWTASKKMQVHQPSYRSDSQSGFSKLSPADHTRKRESSREKGKGGEVDLGCRASSWDADTRRSRSSSLEQDGKRPRINSEGNDVLSRFTPLHANSQLSLSFHLHREKKSDQTSLIREHCPLIDAFLVIDTHTRKRAVTDGAGRHAGLEEGFEPNFVRQRWPEDIEGSRLEKALVADGFCPGPRDSRFRGEAFAFTMLETNTDPNGDPNGVLYCCVCSEDQTLPSNPADSGDSDQENSPKSNQQDRGRLTGGVLCLVSRLPLLGFYFRLLELLRRNLGQVEAILDCVKNMRLEHLAEQGLLLSDIKGSQTLIELQFLPQPPLCDGCTWSDLMGNGAFEPLSARSQTTARWAVSWGLNVLFNRWEGLVEVIKDLLPSVLLEQKVLLLGDVQRISVVAMLLRSMLWPFRWLHLFLSAPPPEECLNIPFLEGTFPMILAMGELPDSWGCESVRQLPAEVITAMLLHDWVYTSPQLETTGGLKGEKIKLPGRMQAEFRKQASQARIYLRKGEIGISEAVSKVQTAAETGVGKLASLVRRYAECRIAAQEAVRAQVSLGVFREKCFSQAIDSDTFLKWLEAEGELDLSSGADSVCFYKTFIQTQLCLDFLNEEIISQTAGFSPD
eukprot:TRINITY_DN25732_c0_g1_i1.p1 TRINITY_DN25732_c0_g1~~TRINITY_DN25732_c0_g1_i1.p1  ORF type:complete len:1824 (-),score=371.31 TRINITY_DN25732_c0_g1_i1:16-5487(-)